MRRQAIAGFFSRAKVAARLDLMQRSVDKLCGHIADFANIAEFNVIYIYLMLVCTLDEQLTSLLLGENTRSSKKKDFGFELSHASQGGGVIM